MLRFFYFLRDGAGYLFVEKIDGGLFGEVGEGLFFPFADGECAYVFVGGGDGCCDAKARGGIAGVGEVLQDAVVAVGGLNEYLCFVVGACAFFELFDLLCAL